MEKGIKAERIVEFVSYDGKFPCLCAGTLILRINGEEVNLGKCLQSGGAVDWTAEDPWDEVQHGEWLVRVPEEYAEFSDEIDKVVNENIPWGCCGGCL